VCGGAEAEQSDALARLNSGYAETAETNNPSAQQRRGIEIVEGVGKAVDEVRAGERVLGVASVDRISGEGGSVAQIFESSFAIGAGSVHATEPGYSNPGAERQIGGGSFNDLAYDLMTGDQRAAERCEFAFNDMEVGPADSAGADAQKNLPRFQAWLRDLFYKEGLLGLIENGSSHKTAGSVLRGLLDFAVLDAVRAHFNAFRGTRDNRVDFL